MGVQGRPHRLAESSRQCSICLVNTEILRSFFLWCALLNYALLLWWFLVFRFAHDQLYRFHGRWFRLSVEQFDAIHYAGMAAYKIGIFLFALAPWLALLIIS